MLTPQMLGLPAKFQTWRDGQARLVEEIVNSDAYAYLLDAPTGTGKSIIGIGAHLLSREPCVYITSTKQLQNQLYSDFPSVVRLKGRSNYACLLHPKEFPDYTTEDCTHTKEKPCPKFFKCVYNRKKARAILASLVVLNTSYFLREANGPGMFSGRKLLVIDELDLMERELMGFIELSVTERELSYLGIPPPVDPTSRDGWMEWMFRLDVSGYINKISRQLPLVEDNWNTRDCKASKKQKHYERFQHKVSRLLLEIDDNWLFTYNEEGTRRSAARATMSRLTGDYWTISFKPILVGPFAQQYLWRHAEKVLGMSGTILKPEVLTGELALEDWTYEQLQSPFPVEHRPIYYTPVVNLTQKTIQVELPKLVAHVDRLINQYPNDKILVHTTSYKIRDYLLENLKSSRLITHESHDRVAKLKEFMESKKPLAMLSPSFDRGIDLHQELCRCIIICKVPYLNLGDDQIKARMKVPGGMLWYYVRAAQTIVQMSGRAVRSMDDYCDTFILDRQFSALRGKVGHIFPKWWREAIR